MGDLVPLFKNTQPPTPQSQATAPEAIYVPSVTEREGNVERTLDPFSWLLMQDRAIMLQDQVSDQLASVVAAQILYLNSIDPTKDIKIYINSPGGSITAGMAIFNAMRHVSCDVMTIGMGMCASMGSFLLSAGTPGKRLILPDTQVLIHRPSWGVNGSENQMRLAGWEITGIRDRLETYYAAFCGGLTDKEFELFNHTMDSDTGMNATAALRAGLVDKIAYPGDPKHPAPAWKKAEWEMKAEVDQKHIDEIDPKDKHCPEALRYLKEFILLREARLAADAAAKQAGVPSNTDPVTHGRPDQRTPVAAAPATPPAPQP